MECCPFISAQFRKLSSSRDAEARRSCSLNSRGGSSVLTSGPCFQFPVTKTRERRLCSASLICIDCRMWGDACLASEQTGRLWPQRSLSVTLTLPQHLSELQPKPVSCGEENMIAAFCSVINVQTPCSTDSSFILLLFLQ